MVTKADMGMLREAVRELRGAVTTAELEVVNNRPPGKRRLERAVDCVLGIARSFSSEVSNNVLPSHAVFKIMVATLDVATLAQCSPKDRLAQCQHARQAVLKADRVLAKFAKG